MEQTAVVTTTMPQDGIQKIDHAPNPLVVIENATRIADELSRIIKHANLFKVINQKKFVYVEGWTTMLAMLGITPEIVDCEKLDREKEIAYRAIVKLVDNTGKKLGGGISMCSSKEKMWGSRDEFAISSMAQTRAVGKAARLSFSWIMTLAGFEPTPAEEMDGVYDAPKLESKKPDPKPEPAKNAHIEDAKIIPSRAELLSAKVAEIHATKSVDELKKVYTSIDVKVWTKEECAVFVAAKDEKLAQLGKAAA